jgi:acetoin utilization deacetylase AcuC-like enzyme
MLNKETLKQAIEDISAREPEIGCTLAGLLASGRIDVPSKTKEDVNSGLYHFTFDNRAVAVKKINLFNEGSAALEQSLLIQYGEMVQKQLFPGGTGPVDYSRAAQSIRSAGLMHLVEYEINRACKELDPNSSRNRRKSFTDNDPMDDAVAVMTCLRDDKSTKDFPKNVHDPRVLFAGAVNADTPAFFIRFPYTQEALKQAADLDLTFFSVRFILRCLVNGTFKNLFACVVDNAIVGLVYLRRHERFLYEGIEIKYIATARDAGKDWTAKNPVYRGVGAFLVAGVWLLWKNTMPRVREIFLDSEITALRFYEQNGFERRRFYVYVLVRPAGRLLNTLAVMIDRSRAIHSRVVDETLGYIQHHVRLLARKQAGHPARDASIAFIKECLLSLSKPELAHTAAKWLLRYKQSIPEVEELLQWASCYGRIRVIESHAEKNPPFFVFKSEALQAHLEGLFHLENANRLKAVDALLGDSTLSGKWSGVNGRLASIEELKWVHTPEHIARIAATAGKKMCSFDLDTQTTKESYNTARLAVGGVFCLLDAVLSIPGSRGFAAVRPPGHHAEPDKAMGFCLFNNAALGACYLQHAWGLKKVMIIDIDAHHGNGTQAAFYSSNQVLFFSMHQFPCYPGSGNFGEIGAGPGEGYTVNVPLDKGMGDHEFIQTIAQAADPLACAFEPDAILVSCGFDLYQHDRLANLNGTPNGYGLLTYLLCRIADMVCGGRIAFILEGGYSVQGIHDCGLRVFQELCNIPGQAKTPPEKTSAGRLSSFPALRKTIAIHAKYWPILNQRQYP